MRLLVILAVVVGLGAVMWSLYTHTIRRQHQAAAQERERQRLAAQQRARRARQRLDRDIQRISGTPHATLLQRIGVLQERVGPNDIRVFERNISQSFEMLKEVLQEVQRFLGVKPQEVDPSPDDLSTDQYAQITASCEQLRTTVYYGAQARETLITYCEQVEAILAGLDAKIGPDDNPAQSHAGRAIAAAEAVVIQAEADGLDCTIHTQPPKRFQTAKAQHTQARKARLSGDLLTADDYADHAIRFAGEALSMAQSAIARLQVIKGRLAALTKAIQEDHQPAEILAEAQETIEQLRTRYIAECWYELPEELHAVQVRSDRLAAQLGALAAAVKAQNLDEAERLAARMQHTIDEIAALHLRITNLQQKLATQIDSARSGIVGLRAQLDQTIEYAAGLPNVEALRDQLAELDSQLKDWEHEVGLRRDPHQPVYLDPRDRADAIAALDRRIRSIRLTAKANDTRE